MEAQNPYFNYLIDPSFQMTSRILCYYLKIMKLEQVVKDVFFQFWKCHDFNVMIKEENFFDQPIRNNIKHIKILETMLQAK